MAVAEKATTMPVMTSACGTGSAPSPAAAPRRAMTPNSRNTPLPRRLKARILRSGCGIGDEAEQSKSHQRGGANSEQRRDVHRCWIRSGGPAASRPSVTPIDSVNVTSIDDDQRLGVACRIRKEGVRQAKPASPMARKITGPTTISSRSQGRLIAGTARNPAIITSSHMAARTAPP